MKLASAWGAVILTVVVASAGWAAPQEAAAPAAEAAQGSHLVTFTGVLKDAGGAARTGAATITFSLYASQEGGEALWSESQTVTVDIEGRYSALLGSSTPGGLPAEVFGEGKAQWLAARVEGEAEQARVLLIAVPYALKAADAETLGGKPVASFVLSEELEKAVERQAASRSTSASPTAASGGSVSPLGLEGTLNTIYGHYAGDALGGGGVGNAFFGAYAGQSTTGSGNTFLGDNAGIFNTTGSANTFVGQWSGGTSTAASGRWRHRHPGPVRAQTARSPASACR